MMLFYKETNTACLLFAVEFVKLDLLTSDSLRHTFIYAVYIPDMLPGLVPTALSGFVMRDL